jgi:cell division protease FtsH
MIQASMCPRVGIRVQRPSQRLVRAFPNDIVAPSTEQVRNVKMSPTGVVSAPPLTDNNKEWSKETFAMEVNDNNVDEVIVYPGSKMVTAITLDGNEHTVRTRLTKDIMDKLDDRGVFLTYKKEENTAQLLAYYLESVIFFALSGVVLYTLFSRGGGSGTFNGLTSSKAKMTDGNEASTTFDDVAGIEHAKLELQEIVDFLKNPEKYSRVGAKIPKGCLLVSPPGCGKTLLARAVAGTAGVPFFSCSASQFIEMFVGVGAARIRDVFNKAKEKAPCIIFIDEIDAIGKARGGPMNLGNDEREQTINQLLTEMDGFESNSGVIVIGATNRADILDKALLRPGRFDRVIYIDSPDVIGREEILRVHTRGKPLADCVDLTALSKITAGFSGADLQNLSNEAAIWAARNDRTEINMLDFENALEKVALGPEKTSRVMSDAKKQIVSVHESGHTIAALCLGDYDKVRKVTIVPRGSAGGVTFFEPSSERVDSGLLSKGYLKNQLVVALGGRAAEEVVFGKEKVTTGASSDMEQVYRIAKLMVTKYGFSNELGNIAWPHQAGMGGDVSEHTSMLIDQEIKTLVENAYTRAKYIMEENLNILFELAQELTEKETLNNSEVEAICKKLKR